MIAMTAHCDFCGLPIAGLAQRESEPLYCCAGCRFADSVIHHEGEAASGDVRAAMTRLGLALFFSMNVMVFTFFLWSEAAETSSAESIVLYELARYICLLLATPVMFLLGRPLLASAVEELRHKTASINLLLLAGVAAAYFYSAWCVFLGAGHVYFEVSCMVLVAVALGRWFEASGKWKTTVELRKLQRLLPDVVRRVSTGGEESVALKAVCVGDVLHFLPGDVIAVDGRIERGEAAIDECMITGESAPVLKSPGGPVFSGTTNIDGDLSIVATAAPGAGTIERLIEAVLQAVQGRTRFERLAERIARWSLPIVMLTAAATFAWHGLHSGLAAGILNALAVVVISCPCALGLATPMALWAAIGQATRRHILVRDGDAFDRLGKATVYCFDKTGTLTEGCVVREVATIPGVTQEAALGLAAALARTSRHPLSAAIRKCAEQAGVNAAEVTSIRSIAGRGISGSANSEEVVLLGSEAWLRSHGIVASLPWEESSTKSELARVLLAIDGQLAAVFVIAQRTREGAQAALAALQALGARTMILSGDSAERTSAVGEALNCEIRAPLLPDEKLAAIHELQRQGEVVAMVGDGLNDAPALAAADIGIALGCGVDVSRWAGQICLLTDDIAAVPWLADLSRVTTATIRWNLLWAFGYNAVCIPLAAAGYLHPAIAAAAMVISSLLVVSNSLRLAGTEVEQDVHIAQQQPAGTDVLLEAAP